jgi:hypothetical protein
MKQQQFWMDEGEWQPKVVCRFGLSFALRVLCGGFLFSEMLGTPQLKDK